MNPTLKDKKSTVRVTVDIFYLQRKLFGEQDGHPFGLRDVIGGVKHRREVAALQSGDGICPKVGFL